MTSLSSDENSLLHFIFIVNTLPFVFRREYLFEKISNLFIDNIYINNDNININNIEVKMK
jgi:hypothetical protein